MQLPVNLPTQRGTVSSSDGTALAYVRIGTGAPLVVCHGSFSVAQDWVPFAMKMAATHSVYLYDRRGRGLNPYAGTSFAVDAEVDDLAVMVELAGPAAAVLGHSFGGGCALSLAARNGFSGSLIVYEPRHSVHAPVSRGQIPAIERLTAAGDKDAATRFVMSHVIGMPAQAIAALRQSPLWHVMCQTVDAFPNELRFLDSLTWRAGDLRRIAGVTTLLVGEQSPVLPDDISPDAALRSLLPGMRTVSIPGQGHFAFIADPALLAGIVGKCVPAFSGVKRTGELL
jgi:pimeloyl-ACP methyl ester carboxylesterase